MDLLIKNGTLITATGRFDADIAVKDGKIEAVYETGLQSHSAPPRTAETVDARGLFVLPGAIDAHTHFELPFGDISSADDFFTGTRAAACGGVTTVMDFVTPGKAMSLMEAYNERRAAADPKVCIDYGLHVSILEASERVFLGMDDVMNAGINSFKVFMTYAFRLTDNGLLGALSCARELGALIMIHAEAHKELESRKSTFIAQGQTDTWHHYLSRPESVETKGVERAIALARDAGAALYIVHLACAGGVAAVRRAQHEGLRIYAETCPQYLHFTNEVYRRGNGHIFICSPPIKSQESRDALWEGIGDGTISTVATDHCPFTLAQKARGKENFTKTPNGVMGTGTMYPYMLNRAVRGHISFERAVDLCCRSPAKIFGLDTTKGSIAAGKDADIVLFDPNTDTTVSQKKMHSATDYTIWDGVLMKGRIVSTYSRGKLVYKDGEFRGQQGHGRFVAAVR